MMMKRDMRYINHYSHINLFICNLSSYFKFTYNLYSVYLYLNPYMCLYISLFLWNVGPIQQYELKLNKFFWSAESIILVRKSNALHHPFKKLQKVYWLLCGVIRLLIFTTLHNYYSADLDIFWSWSSSVCPQCHISLLNVYAQEFQPGGLRGCH